MKQTNIQIIETFFKAYADRDRERLATVLDENAQWTNLGKHPMAGVHKGIEEIMSFFDRMGKVMGDLDHRACVLWRFSDGKIVEGTHFFSDHDAVDRFFTAVAE